MAVPVGAQSDRPHPGRPREAGGPQAPVPQLERADRSRPGRAGNPREPLDAGPVLQLGAVGTAPERPAPGARRREPERLRQPRVRPGGVAGLAGDHRVQGAAVRGRPGRDGRRGRRPYAGRARGGGRGRRDRGGHRPHGRRGQPGLRGGRAAAAAGPGRQVRGAIRRDGRLVGRSRAARRPVGRPHGRGACPARQRRGGPRAPDRRCRQGRRRRHRPFRRRLRPHRPPRRGRGLRARAGAQHGAPARPVRVGPRGPDAGGSGVRLREPGGCCGGGRAVQPLAHPDGLQRGVHRRPRPLSVVAPVLESAPDLRRRPPGGSLRRRRRVGPVRAGGRGRGPRDHRPGGGAVAGPPRRRQPAPGGRGVPARPGPDAP